MYFLGLGGHLLRIQEQQREYEMARGDDMFERVIDVLDGRVHGSDAQQVLAQVSADPEWADAYHWMTEFLATAQTSKLQPVPASTRLMLERLLTPRPTLVDEIHGIVRSVARLVRDTASGTAFAGARGAATTRRQLEFKVTEDSDLVMDLDLNVDPLIVSGQLLGPVEEYQARLVSEHETIIVTSDEFGEFTASVPATTFLRLDLDGDNVHCSVDLTPFLDEGN
jgi:hypothetical protein